MFRLAVDTGFDSIMEDIAKVVQVADKPLVEAILDTTDKIVTEEGLRIVDLRIQAMEQVETQIHQELLVGTSFLPGEAFALAFLQEV